MATLTVTARPAGFPPNIAITLANYSGTGLTLNRVGPDGTRSPVREAESGTIVAGGWSGVDYEAPYGVPVCYELPGGQQSPYVTLSPPRAWLVDPGAPALSVPLNHLSSEGVEIASLGDRTSDVASSALWPMGATTPIVWSSVRRKPATQLILRTWDSGSLKRLDAALASGTPLLFVADPALGWEVSWEYLSIGSVTSARLYAYGPDPLRQWALPYQVVGRPVGGLLAEWAWGDVANAFTWAGVENTFATWADLAANKRIATPGNPLDPGDAGPVGAPAGVFGSDVYGSGVYGSTTSSSAGATTGSSGSATGSSSSSGSSTSTGSTGTTTGSASGTTTGTTIPATWGELAGLGSWAQVATQYASWAVLAGSTSTTTTSPTATPVYVPPL